MLSNAPGSMVRQIEFAARESAAPLAAAVAKQLLRSALAQKLRLLAPSLFVLARWPRASTI